MAITVIDAMNGMGQDWECSEVLRAEVHRLRADLVAAEQRASESDARAERLAAALEDAHSTLYTLSQMAHNWDGMGTAEQYKAMIDQNVIRASRARKRIHAVLTAPATQPDERAAEEREIIEQAREVLSLMPNTANSDVWKSTPDGDPCIPWTMHAVTILAIDDLRDALLALDATDGAAKEEG